MARRVYSPTPRQQDFHASPAPERWYCAGYGAGKTTATVVEAVALATRTHPGFTGIVAAPTFPLLFQSWFGEWKRLVPRSAWELKRDPHEGPHILMPTPLGPSKIYLRSTKNPWSNEGINAAWMVFDEATRERDRSAVDVLLSRVRRGYPGRQLCSIFSGPPSTRRHWSAEQFGTGPDASHRGSEAGWTDGRRAVIRARTRDNPHLPAGYEQSLRTRPGSSKAWCAQWLDASFGSVEGQVYAAFDRAVHVLPAASLAGRQWRAVTVGTDWGWEHPGVMVVVAQDAFGDLFLLREEVHQRLVVAPVEQPGVAVVPPGSWVDVAKRLVASHRVESMACDPSAPGSIRTLGMALRSRGTRVFGGDNDVTEGLQRVTAALERAAARGTPDKRGLPGLWVSDACHSSINEFESYARKRARDGSVLEEVEKRGDDVMDALRYAVMHLTGRGT